MGLATKGENGVKKVLKTRYSKDSVFQTFATIGDARRALAGSRSEVTSAVDGNVRLNRPPRWRRPSHARFSRRFS
jgi:hypothetical protein